MTLIQGYMLQKFVSIVEEQNSIHGKFLRKSLLDITPEEIVKFENLLSFYMLRENDTIDKIVEKYLNKIFFLIEDQLFFIENGRYRFSTFSEVENYYKNKEYMGNYTVGLGLSTYLWPVHREVMRFFQKYLQSQAKCKNYFEIGPGHGEYMVTAMKQTRFFQYIAVDISKTSVELTQDYIRYSYTNKNGVLKNESIKNYSIIHDDFFAYQGENLFDTIVMGEVLEHVENPLIFLKKIYQIASDDAHIFITTAINAPQPDHIFLFKTFNEIVNLFETSSFIISDFIAVNTNNVPLETAEKKKIPIVVAFIIKKTTHPHNSLP